MLTMVTGYACPELSVELASPTFGTSLIAFPVVLQDSQGSTYVYGLELISRTDNGGNQEYYLTDGLGSTSDLRDGTGSAVAGYSYDVFGAIRSQSGSSPNEFTFTGEQVDSTGLQYLRARYYDPASGRFVGRDPLFGSLRDPVTQNRYPYVGSNPINRLDPSGLSYLSSSGIGIYNKEGSRFMGSPKCSDKPLSAFQRPCPTPTPTPTPPCPGYLPGAKVVRCPSPTPTPIPTPAYCLSPLWSGRSECGGRNSFGIGEIWNFLRNSTVTQIVGGAANFVECVSAAAAVGLPTLIVGLSSGPIAAAAIATACGVYAVTAPPGYQIAY